MCRPTSTVSKHEPLRHKVKVAKLQAILMRDHSTRVGLIILEVSTDWRPRNFLEARLSGERLCGAKIPAFSRCTADKAPYMNVRFFDKDFYDYEKVPDYQGPAPTKESARLAAAESRPDRGTN